MKGRTDTKDMATRGQPGFQGKSKNRSGGHGRKQLTSKKKIPGDGDKSKGFIQRTYRCIVFYAIVKIIPVNTYMCIYYYCVNLRVRLYLHVCMIIYIVIVHSRRLYT